MARTTYSSASHLWFFLYFFFFFLLQVQRVVCASVMSFCPSLPLLGWGFILLPYLYCGVSILSCSNVADLDPLNLQVVCVGSALTLHHSSWTFLDRCPSPGPGYSRSLSGMHLLQPSSSHWSTILSPILLELHAVGGTVTPASLGVQVVLQNSTGSQPPVCIGSFGFAFRSQQAWKPFFSAWSY